MFSFKNKKKKENLLVLDVGAEATKALLFERGKTDNLLSYSLEYLDDVGFSETAIHKVFLRTFQNLRITKAPENIILGLPNIVLKAKISEQLVKRKNAEDLINKIEYKIILEKITKSAKKEISEKISGEIGILPKDISFTDLKIIETKID